MGMLALEDDPHAVPRKIVLGSLGGALRERCVGDQDGHRFGLWILLPCDLKEAFSQGQVWVGPRRNHHEILRVVELRVNRERHETKKESLALVAPLEK